jgi:NAD(P) transhydrogenase
MNKVDLLVIGSGPAGQRAAIQGVKLGKNVVIVEKQNSVGGVCANTGTIPSKTLREAVMYLSGYRQRGVYGRSYSVKKDVTFRDLNLRIRHVVGHEVEVTRDRLIRTGVQIIHGTASFRSPHDIDVKTETGVRTFEAAKVIICTGTKPYHADRVPFNGRTIIDTDAIFHESYDIEKIPKSILIIGGGVIGTEYACMFAAMGVDVRLLDRRTELFRFVDVEICEALNYQMRNERITLYLGKDFVKVEEDADGKVITTLENQRQIKTDVMMFASGRTGAIEELNLEAAGVTVTSRGLIEVDKNLRTNVPHIFAAGDIVGFPALASTSMEQGRMAACTAFGVPFFCDTELLPYGIYTIPEISMVGRTEQDLSEEGIPYEIGIARYREVSKGTILGDDSGMLKLVFHQKTGRLLGVHILGEGASELLHIGQAVMAFNGSISYFVDTVFNYPTLAEAYKIAALHGLKRVGAQAKLSKDFAIPKAGHEEAVTEKAVEEGSTVPNIAAEA